MKPEDTKHDAPDHQKTTSIVVNAQQKTVRRHHLVRAAGEPRARRQPADRRRLGVHDHVPPGNGNKPEGSIVAGETVKLKEGMIFDVRSTDRS